MKKISVAVELTTIDAETYWIAEAIEELLVEGESLDNIRLERVNEINGGIERRASPADRRKKLKEYLRTR